MSNPAPLQPATHFPAILGQVLAWLREHKGVTQGAMAERMGVSHPTWSRVERGEAPLRIPQLAAAARLLDADPAEVLRLAERARADAERRGVRVLEERPPDWLVAGAIVIGAAALAALIGALLAKR